jgi:hypothetical protein
LKPGMPAAIAGEIKMGGGDGGLALTKHQSRGPCPCHCHYYRLSSSRKSASDRQAAQLRGIHPLSGRLVSTLLGPWQGGVRQAVTRQLRGFGGPWMTR